MKRITFWFDPISPFAYLAFERLPQVLQGISHVVEYRPLLFGAIMLATRLDKVGEAAVLRETSTVFAALIGWLVLGEKVGPVRTALMAMIALGAVIMEFAG